MSPWLEVPQPDLYPSVSLGSCAAFTGNLDSEDQPLPRVSIHLLS